jgi:hypothetical protein
MFVTFEHFEGMTMFQHIHTSLIAWRKVFFVGLFTAGMSSGLHSLCQSTSAGCFHAAVIQRVTRGGSQGPCGESRRFAKTRQLGGHACFTQCQFSTHDRFCGGPCLATSQPEQQKRLQEEFKMLLVRSYAGALSQAKDSIPSWSKAFKGSADDNEVVVRSEIRGGSEPIPLDYRLEKSTDAPGGWKIYNFNVLGVWLVDNYRTQFSQEINAKGVDGLIATLSERNKANNRQMNMGPVFQLPALTHP